ncbi:MAG: DUF58 domain-containing protein [Gammaproteobacteria bacterium]|nr:DUF58 domain-containing protein [Gammaproteobacteria bacterium]
MKDHQKSAFKSVFRVSLTLNGLGMLCSVLVLFLFGVNYNSNLLFTLCFIFVGVMIVCFWLNIINIKALSGLNVNVEPVHAGQSLDFKIDVIDQAKRDHLDLSANGKPVADVNCKQQQQWLLNDITGKRGLHKASILRISSRWPLGFFDSARNLMELPAVVIYPEAVAPCSPRHAVEGNEAHLHNDADSLVGLKEYQAGDNARRIDWRAMARLDQLQVKLFDGGSGDASVWLDWNDTIDMNYEQRISSLCRWIIDYHQQGTEFGLRLPDFNAGPANSYSHLHQCLYQLSMMPLQASSEESP